MTDDVELAWLYRNTLKFAEDPIANAAVTTIAKLVVKDIGFDKNAFPP